VQFTVQAAFSRNVDTSYFKGSALDGFARVGDKVTMTGRETPMFDFGDGFEQRMDMLELTVIAYSVRENWILGEKVLPGHVYPTPNDEGREGSPAKPWFAKFTGCCRLGQLVNNADSPWVLTAEVDLQKALASPRVGILPMISVPSTAFRDPFTPSTILNGPSFRVPATSAVPQEDRCDRRVKHWELEKPWAVGTAARFKSDSAVSVSLAGFSTTDAMSCCTTPATCLSPPDAAKPSVSAGCLFRLLRSDNQQRALTVEGWVRIDQPAGGVVMKTGRMPGSTCPESHKGICDVSLIQVHVNASHITVGHETYMPSTGSWALRTVSFEIASNMMLVNELNDPQYYSNAPQNSIHNKWVHVAVVRKTNSKFLPGSGENYFQHWFSTYKVYVNGHALETQRLTGCTRTSANPCQGEGRAGVNFYGFEDNNGLLSDQYDPGESNPVAGPRLTGPYADGDFIVRGRCKWNGEQVPACIDGFGNGTALVFGMFEGDLDEWRFWNGERSQTDIQSWFQKPLSPDQSVYYGDPTEGGPVTRLNYETVSLLVASYNFDWDRSQIGSCEGSQLAAGCPFDQLEPIFPENADDKYTAVRSGDVVFVDTGTSRLMFYESGEIFQLEEGGVIRFRQATPIPVGMYQVTVRVAIDMDMPRVPVDFIVEVLNQDGFSVDGDLGVLGDGLCKFPQYPCLYNTTLNAFAPTLNVTGNIAGVATGDENHCDVGSYITSTARFVRGDQREGLLNVNDFVYPNRLRAYAGFEMSLTFRGMDSQMRAGIRDAVDTQVGFSIGPAPAYGRFSTVKGTNPSEMTMEWTPCVADLTSVVCVEAVDYHVDRHENTVARSAASQSKCVALQVERDPAPMWLGERARTVNFIMGRPTSITLIAVEHNSLDEIEIDVVGGQLPPGATLSHGDLPCLHCLNKTVTMSWTPGQDMGGYTATLQFRVKDTGGACPGAEGQEDIVEVHLVVAKCRYMVQKDMQLQELASVFHMDWIRLWSLNSMEASLNHPDYLVLAEPAQVINVGHTYRVLAGTETLEQITRRFGMTMEQLKQLNYDLMDATEVMEGARLCVVPNSCTGLSQTIYSGLQYQDNKFLNNAAGVFEPPRAQ